MEPMFRAEGTKIIPLAGAQGPWMPDAVSGAAIGPLIAALSEDVPLPCPMLTTRMSIEFLRPVPMRSLDVTTEIVREGRKQQVLRIGIGAGGKLAAQAIILRIRTDPAPPFETGTDFVPPSFQPFVSRIKTTNPITQWLDCHPISSNDFGPGISELWMRYRGVVLEGRKVTPLMQAGLFADFGNGLAPLFSPATHSYLNADLTLHLARLPVGEWINLKARTLSAGNGLAMTCVEIGDARGQAGWSHQSLLIEARG